jgi:hypothetical protein
MTNRRVSRQASVRQRLVVSRELEAYKGVPSHESSDRPDGPLATISKREISFVYAVHNQDALA